MRKLITALVLALPLVLLGVQTVSAVDIGGCC